MKRWHLHLCFAASLLVARSAAHAQQYDANCQPATFTEDQQFEQEVCKSHAGCAMIFAGAQKLCSGIDFLRNIGDKITGTKPLTNDDVFDASEPEFPKSTFTNQITSKIKNVTDAVFASKPEMSTYRAQDGSVGYSETLPSGAGKRAGTIIYSDGAKSRGQFEESSWRLNGVGEFVAGNGAIRAGDFQNGALSGQGFKTEPSGKSADAYEGTFDKGVPVGEIIHRFPDGTSVREQWQNGKMIARGPLAPKGQVPPPIADSSAPASVPESSVARTEPTSSSNTVTPAPSMEPGLSGDWRGDNSGNEVTLTRAPGGYNVASAGGSSNAQFFQARPDGSLVFTFPDGNQSVAQPLPDGTIRISQPGFTDVFRRKPPASKARPEEGIADEAAETAAPEASPLPRNSPSCVIIDAKIDDYHWHVRNQCGRAMKFTWEFSNGNRHSYRVDALGSTYINATLGDQGKYDQGTPHIIDESPE